MKRKSKFSETDSPPNKKTKFNPPGATRKSRFGPPIIKKRNAEIETTILENLEKTVQNEEADDDSNQIENPKCQEDSNLPKQNPKTNSSESTRKSRFGPPMATKIGNKIFTEKYDPEEALAYQKRLGLSNNPNYNVPSWGEKPKEKHYCLEVYKGPVKVNTVGLFSQISFHTLGRSLPVSSIKEHLQIRHNTASKLHGVLQCGFEKVFVFDESSNGTFVNGKRITKRQYIEIKIGDRVGFGLCPNHYFLCLFEKPCDEEELDSFELELRKTAAESKLAKIREVEERRKEGAKKKLEMQKIVQSEVEARRKRLLQYQASLESAQQAPTVNSVYARYLALFPTNLEQVPQSVMNPVITEKEKRMREALVRAKQWQNENEPKPVTISQHTDEMGYQRWEP